MDQEMAFSARLASARPAWRPYLAWYEDVYGVCETPDALDAALHSLGYWTEPAAETTEEV